MKAAAIALGLAEAGAHQASERWLALAFTDNRDGLLLWDAHDSQVAPSPIDAEDTPEEMHRDFCPEVFPNEGDITYVVRSAT